MRSDAQPIEGVATHVERTLSPTLQLLACSASQLASPLGRPLDARGINVRFPDAVTRETISENSSVQDIDEKTTHRRRRLWNEFNPALNIYAHTKSPSIETVVLDQLL